MDVSTIYVFVYMCECVFVGVRKANVYYLRVCVCVGVDICVRQVEFDLFCFLSLSVVSFHGRVR